MEQFMRQLGEVLVILERQVTSLGDKKGLVAVFMIVVRVNKFFIDWVAVKVLLEAQVLEKDQEF